MLKRFLIPSLLLLCQFAGSAGAIEKGGALLVDVNASTYTAGNNVWTNAGTYGDFTKVGSPQVLTVGSAPAVAFNGRNDAFVGSKVTPESITGFEGRTIEAWVFNPTISSEETIVSWGKRGGPDGTNMAFNYGNHGAFGAVGHWGAPDIGWNDAGGAPDAFKWHHLVYTYDEEFTRVYADGQLMNEENVLGILPNGLNTHGDTAIAIASQWEGNATAARVGDPALLTGALKGSLGINRLRIHEAPLTAAQIKANYDEEKALFANNPTPPDPPVVPTPVAKPLRKGPIHRYSFNEAAGDATDKKVTDSIGSAHGTVLGEGGSFSGTGVQLPGGPSATAAYVDLPNGLLSKLSATSLEAWVTVEASQNWGRIFDFGSNSPGGVNGELPGPGDTNDDPDGDGVPNGDGVGLDYFELSSQIGGDTNAHRLEIRDQDPAGGGATTTLDVSLPKELPADVHFVAVYDPEGGIIRDLLLRPVGTQPSIKVYGNGKLLGEATTDIKLSNLNDVNNWLGRSNWTADSNFQGTFDEFRIYDYAMNSDEVLGNNQAGPTVMNIQASLSDCNKDGKVDKTDLQCIITAGGAGALNTLLGELKLVSGDLDADGTVAFADFLVLSANFGQNVTSYTLGDIDANGNVAFADFLILSSNFGKTGGVAASVPEPTTIAFSLLGIVGLGLRRRRSTTFTVQ